MKKLLIFVIVISAVLWRAIAVEQANPAQWSAVWANFRDSLSVTGLAKDTYNAMAGEKVAFGTMSEQQGSQIVYKWVDSWGQTKISYQKPANVENVEEIRLGDLDYKVEESLSQLEIYEATKSAKTDKDKN